MLNYEPDIETPVKPAPVRPKIKPLPKEWDITKPKVLPRPKGNCHF